MSDLINRKDVLDKAWDCPYDGRYIQVVDVGDILELPSAQPEIIRCKDCKHMVEHKHYGNLGESAYTCEGNMDGWVLPDSFCSMAERRNNE